MSNRLPHWLRPTRTAVPAARPSRLVSRFVRPRIETLEDRVTPTNWTWVGGTSGGLWSDATNWNDPLSNTGVPVSGDTVIFGSGNVSSIDDIASLSLAEVRFRSTGNVIDVQASLTVDGSNNGVTDNSGNNTIESTNASSLIVANADMPVSETAASGNLVFTIAITGGFGLKTTGSGIVELGGSSQNTYIGTTTVSDGTLILSNSAFFSVHGALVIGGNTVGATAATVQLSIGEQIPSSAAVTIHDTGTLELNSFTQTLDNLTIDGGSVIGTTGTLQIDGGSTLHGGGTAHAGTISADIFLNGGTVTFNVNDGNQAAATDLTLSGAIHGTGSAILTGPPANPITGLGGPGTLELSGSTSNDFAGTFTDQVGSLSLNKSGGALAVETKLVVGPGNQNFAATAQELASNQLGDSAEVDVEGSTSTFSLNTFSDTVAVVQVGFSNGNFIGGTLDTGTGTLTVTGLTGLAGGTISGTRNATGTGVLVVQGGVEAFTVFNAAQSSVISAQVEIDTTQTFDVPTGPPAVNLNVSGPIVGSGGLIKTGAGVMQVSGTDDNTYQGGTTIDAGTFQLGKSAPFLGVVATSIPAGAVVIGDGIDVAVVQSLVSDTIDDSCTLQINPNGTFDLNSFSETLGTGGSSVPVSVVGGAINTDAAGNGGILTVDGEFDMSAGLVTVEGGGGNVTVNGVTNLSGGNVNVLAGGTFTTNGLLQVSATASSSGAGNIVLGDNVEATGGTPVLSSGIDLNGATRTFTVDSGADLSVNGVVRDTIASGTGVIKDGPGIMAYADNGAPAVGIKNTYDGLTLVLDGTLQLNRTTTQSPQGGLVTDNSIQGNLSVGDGTGSGPLAVVVYLQSNQINNSSAISVVADGTFFVNGFADSVGPTSVSSPTSVSDQSHLGTLNLGASGQLTVEPTFTMTGGRVIAGDPNNTANKSQLVVNGTYDQSGGTFTVTDNGSPNSFPPGGLTVTGQAFQTGGAMVLGTADAVTVSGPFTYSGGTFNLADASKVTDSGTLTLVGTTITGSGTGQVVIGGSLAASASPVTAVITAQVNLNGIDRLFNVDTGATLLISGVISSQGHGFTKTGAGLLRLTGANSYTGATVPEAGILQMDGIQNAATAGPVNMGGGHLTGTGSIGAVSGAGGGIITPGDNGQPGILKTGNVTLGGSTLQMTFNSSTAGTGYSQLAVTGTVDVTNASLGVALHYTPGLGTVFTIINNDSTNPQKPDAVIGTFAGLPEGAVLDINGVPLQVSYKGGDGNDVTLTVVLPPTATFFTVTPAPTIAGQPATFGVTVTSTYGTPSGTVAFLDGNTQIGTAPVVNGTATFTTSSLKPGTHTITAFFTSPSFGTSSASTTATVDAIPVSPVIHLTAVGAGQGGQPAVRVYNDDGTLRFAFFAYTSTFTGGVRVAIGDVNGDGVDDIITAPGKGMAPTVEVFSGVDLSPLGSFNAYQSSFTNGVYVAAGDFNGDGKADIVTGPGKFFGRKGPGSEVKVFDGRDFSILDDFLAYGTKYNAGVTVAAGDVNGDGEADIITGNASGNTEVKAFSGRDQSVIFDFSPYGKVRGGVYVAAGDLNGDGHAEIITAPGQGGGPDVMVFDGATHNQIANFYAYDSTFTGGVTVAVGGFSGDNKPAVVTGAGKNGGAVVKSFDGTTFSPLQGFTSFEDFQGPVYVG
jgi:autotransporter-associated beta strand protein